MSVVWDTLKCNQLVRRHTMVMNIIIISCYEYHRYKLLWISSLSVVMYQTKIDIFKEVEEVPFTKLNYITKSQEHYKYNLQNIFLLSQDTLWNILSGDYTHHILNIYCITIHELLPTELNHTMRCPLVATKYKIQIDVHISNLYMHMEEILLPLIEKELNKNYEVQTLHVTYDIN